ncbi:CAP-Gly domain-containing linker protein 4 isoform X2 [Spea bombifrons]|uniref:CAP-Gly domain-containing linker protein 4 isoform X2 n=1 Tax=Spea bombifrons TaxID=233779 RepID=UPI002349FDCF|nr:CAP-Gly domain-containing linker protein 4 isoform X2 [Spea bombifrons]
MTVGDWAVGRPEEDFLRFARCYYPGSGAPVTFCVAAAPMPMDCEFSFFDPNDASCQDILYDPNTSIPELFAILRQWVPQVQQNIDIIGNEILKRGCSVNDRDGLTDMTLLHYTCKSGAQGIGDAETSARFASRLIGLGADVSLRSRWTNMNALHYAAYFDVPELIDILLKASKPKDVDATCHDFEFGTALHIAASNLCLGAVKTLLEHRANPAFRDDKGRIPADVVPDPVDMPLEMADAAAVAKDIRQILLDAMPLSCDLSKLFFPNRDGVSGTAALQAAGLKLGDRVLIAGQKVGTLRYCGPAEFASGQWAGIEMDEPDGKNDGGIGGIQYFKCPAQHGIFAPLSKIRKAVEPMKTFIRSSSNRSSASAKTQKIDLSRVTSKINTGLVLSKRNSANESLLSTDESSHPKKDSQNRPPCVGGPERGDFHAGDRVLVVGQRTGTVRFYGKTSFAPGYWCGIELDKPHGKNDGSISGVQYFTCPPKHGIFAPPSRVQRVSGSSDSLSEIPVNKLNYSFPGLRRSYSSSSTSHKEADRRHSSGRPKKPALRRSWSSSAAGSVGDGGVKLHKGSQVLLTSSNEMAIIRYVGPTDFAPGVWLGLELRSAKGKNDGSVGEKRYFHCKPNHGVLVRPSRVTYRGINGSKLVDEVC